MIIDFKLFTKIKVCHKTFFQILDFSKNVQYTFGKQDNL